MTIQKKLNLNKDEILTLFEEPKVVSYSPEEITNNWMRWESVIGNLKLEGAVYDDTFILFLKEMARGEYPEENKRRYDFEKDRLEKKLVRMKEYGLTVDDIPC